MQNFRKLLEEKQGVILAEEEDGKNLHLE